MKFFGLLLLIFGITLIIFPNSLAYLLGGFFVFMGINILLLPFVFKKGNGKDEYVKFGDYKIYRGK